MATPTRLIINRKYPHAPSTVLLFGISLRRQVLMINDKKEYHIRLIKDTEKIIS